MKFPFSFNIIFIDLALCYQFVRAFQWFLWTMVFCLDLHPNIFEWVIRVLMGNLYQWWSYLDVFYRWWHISWLPSDSKAHNKVFFLHIFPTSRRQMSTHPLLENTVYCRAAKVPSNVKFREPLSSFRPQENEKVQNRQLWQPINYFDAQQRRLMTWDLDGWLEASCHEAPSFLLQFVESKTSWFSKTKISVLPFYVANRTSCHLNKTLLKDKNPHQILTSQPKRQDKDFYLSWCM